MKLTKERKKLLKRMYVLPSYTWLYLLNSSYSYIYIVTTATKVVRTSIHCVNDLYNRSASSFDNLIAYISHESMYLEFLYCVDKILFIKGVRKVPKIFPETDRRFLISYD